MAALLEELARDAQARYEARREGRALGPSSGFARLDEILGGCLWPGLHVLHGDPGAGKSALALRMACECGAPAVYVTTEMGALEVARRLAARVSRRSLGAFRSGEIAPDEMGRIAREIEARVPHLAILDATVAPASPEVLMRAIDDRRGREPHVFVVIDSAHGWINAQRPDGASEYDALGEGLEALHALALRLECPILAVAERNRASRRVGRAGLDASAGSRVFEYRAATVVALDLDTDERPPDGPVPVRLSVQKNRYGPLGAVRFSFDGAQQEFRPR